MKAFKRLFIITMIALSTSCSVSKKISYFQDVPKGQSAIRLPSNVAGENIDASSAHDIRIRPDDKISIIVNSKDNLLANLFNLPIVTRQVGDQAEYTSYPQGLSGYTIDKNGNIDFPVIGQIKVEGMTREEIATYIKETLISKNLVKDPVVTVEYMNLTISVLGEVTRPGKYQIDRDKISILDALSMAGDLTIFGERDNVRIMRLENGTQHTYKMNLCSAEETYSSPVFYLQQNDVVYVEPNPTKARQSTVNGNNIRSTSFWLSLASLLTSVGILISNSISK